VSFVDTNVLVYATADGAPFQDKARAALVGVAANEKVSISRQVLREYLAVMTRPQTWGKPLNLTEAMADATTFTTRFGMLEDGPAVWDQLRALSRDHAFAGRQVHDANIVATMLAHGEHRLLTFNTGDFLRFSGLVELVTL
jgi:toxin-antitoxin system PIN domain toxin